MKKWKREMSEISKFELWNWHSSERTKKEKCWFIDDDDDTRLSVRRGSYWLWFMRDKKCVFFSASYALIVFWHSSDKIQSLSYPCPNHISCFFNSIDIINFHFLAYKGKKVFLSIKFDSRFIVLISLRGSYLKFPYMQNKGKIHCDFLTK